MLESLNFYLSVKWKPMFFLIVFIWCKVHKILSFFDQKKNGFLKIIFDKALTPFWKTFLQLIQLFNAKLSIFKLHICQCSENYRSPASVTKRDKTACFIDAVGTLFLTIPICFVYFSDTTYTTIMSAAQPDVFNTHVRFVDS